MTQQAIGISNTHVVKLGGEVRYCNAENFQDVCDELVAKHGGKPEVTPLEPFSIGPQRTDPVVAGTEDRSSARTAPTAVPAPADIAGGQLDVRGRDRSLLDFAAAEQAGFAPKQTVYARGTRVIDLGVDNARTSRLEHEAKPTVREYCNDFVAQVQAEERADRTVNLTDLRMRADGTIINGEAHLPFVHNAFGQLLTRTGIGGREYLTKCPPQLRATNVNTWLRDMSEHEIADQKVHAANLAGANWQRRQQLEKNAPQRLTGVLRMRNNPKTDREVFAVVSEGYASFDVDKIAQALALAAPSDARGSVTYDGFKARFEIMFHSNVQPEKYVAGEFFKAGVLVRTDDTGGGGIKVSAVVFQNLCLNLIIIDDCEQEVVSIRHRGSVDRLAKEFQEGFKKALSKLGHFQKAWGYALHDNVVEAAARAAGDDSLVGMPISKFLPGLFNGIIERELVPVRGRRKDTVAALVKAFDADNSAARIDRNTVTRAAVVNAFTRYAHETAAKSDPWIEDEIQRGAGALLFAKKGANPAALPYLELEL